MFWLFYHLFAGGGGGGTSLKLADFTMRYAYTQFPCNSFFFASMLHYTLLSTQIFCSFSFNFHRFLAGGRDVCLGFWDLRLEWPWTCWYGEYGARTYCGKNYRVGMRTKWNETKIEREKQQQQQHELNGMQVYVSACACVCVESVYLVVCLSRGTAKTLERCRQRYTIGTSYTTRQFVFGWVVSEPPLEFIFRE